MRCINLPFTYSLPYKRSEYMTMTIMTTTRLKMKLLRQMDRTALSSWQITMVTYTLYIYIYIYIYIYTGWPKKSEPLPFFQKIVLKIANEIRFLRKVKV